MKRGFITIATEDFRPFVIAYIRSLRRIHSEPIEIITNGNLDVSFVNCRIIKVNAPIWANSITSTAYMLRLYASWVTEFDVFIYQDADVYVNTDMYEIFEQAEKGLLCLNPIRDEVGQLQGYPQEWRKLGKLYNDGIYGKTLENEKKYFGNLLKMALEYPQMASSQELKNKAIYLMRRAGIDLPIWEIPEKYVFKLWDINKKYDPIYALDHTELQPVLYHLGTGHGKDKALSWPHPAVEAYKKLMV